MHKSALVFLMMITLPACGYQWIGVSLNLPNSAKSLGIAPIQNQTYQSDIDIQMSRILQRLFQENPNVQLVTPEQADLLLTVELASFSEKQTSISPDTNVIDLRLNLESFATLTDLRTNQDVWIRRRYSVNYSISYQQHKNYVFDQSLKKITEELSKKIYDQIFFDF